MVNPFLSGTVHDTETAIMLERAYIHDIGNAVAYTDGDKIFINTPDNLFKILPAYDDNMLKWLLWHERMHIELRHHNRFFKYLEELSAEETEDKFQVTKDEVNIIMDILVHDWMAGKFPELVETAVNNLAQFRDRNSLKYTFKYKTLEEMLDEYSKFKHDEGDSKSDSKTTEEEETEDGDGEGIGDTPSEDKKEEKSEDPTSKAKGKAGHEEGGSSGEDTSKDEAPKIDEESEQPAPGHHDETDWSKLDDLDSKEFITEREGERYIEEINKLKSTKIRLARIAKTLNGLVTTTKVRSYKTPSYMQTGQRTIFKGSKNGKASLYLCFDASGSMGSEMETFKEIISSAIPQAMKTPTEWFSGYVYSKEDRHIMKRCINPEGRDNDYYKGTFKDFMCVSADSGYSDDGDRTIEMCWKAEQAGYSPIGITDGGGCISWSIDMIKDLKRTVLVGKRPSWLKDVQRINPKIQIICTREEE